MHAQLNQMIAQQRTAEAQRAGEQARLAGEVQAERRNSPDPKPISRLSAHLPHLTARSAPTRP